jgi:excinuclease UvrABC ATPase subunit
MIKGLKQDAFTGSYLSLNSRIDNPRPNNNMAKEVLDNYLSKNKNLDEIESDN